MTRRVLHLGAGRLMTDTIRSLQRGGFEVFAIDRNPNAPAQGAADGFAAIDTSDHDRATEYARHIRADVVLPVNDIGVMTAAVVNERLDLPGIRPDVSVRYVQKADMRRAWDEAGLLQPRFTIVDDPADIREAARALGLPVVVKPSANCGSRGVSLAGTEADLEWSASFAREHAAGDRYVVEQYVEGTEITIEGIVQNGKTVVLTRSDKEHQPHPRFRVAMGLNYPAKLSDAQNNESAELMQNAVSALGSFNGAFHCECIVNEHGIHLVEIGARGGGGHIFGRIVEAVTGLEFPLLVVKQILGESIDTTPLRNAGACYRFFAPPPGRFLGAAGIDEARQLPGILDLGLELAPGTDVGAISGDADRPGWVVSTGATREEAMANAQRAIESIRFAVA